MSGIQKCIIKEAGLDFVYNVVFELKFKPKPESESNHFSDEDIPNDKEVNKPNDGKTMEGETENLPQP